MNTTWFERLATRLRGGRPALPEVSADADGLRVGDVLIAWSDIRRLEAFKRDVYVGESLCIAVLGADGQVVEISEASPGWDAALDAVERFLPGAMARAQWTLRLLAADRSLTIYAQG